MWITWTSTVSYEGLVKQNFKKCNNKSKPAVERRHAANFFSSFSAEWIGYEKSV